MGAGGGPSGPNTEADSAQRDRISPRNRRGNDAGFGHGPARKLAALLHDPLRRAEHRAPSPRMNRCSQHLWQARLDMSYAPCNLHLPLRKSKKATDDRHHRPWCDGGPPSECGLAERVPGSTTASWRAGPGPGPSTWEEHEFYAEPGTRPPGPGKRRRGRLTEMVPVRFPPTSSTKFAAVPATTTAPSPAGSAAPSNTNSSGMPAEPWPLCQSLCQWDREDMTWPERVRTRSSKSRYVSEQRRTPPKRPAGSS